MDTMTNWNVFEMCHEPISSYGLVLLNEALFYEDLSNILKLWKSAAVRICVDGGTNSFYKLMHLPQPDINLPDIISGDFDSIEANVLKHFEGLGVKIIPTPDEDDTDFTKALIALGEHINKLNIKITHVITVAGINSNRFDHTLAHLNTLLKMKELLSVPVIIMSGKTLMWILSPGCHLIEVPPCDYEHETNSWCGYASFSGPAIVSTKGLKWDVENQEVSFGKMISTSNTYDANADGRVTITCSSSLLWFMGWVS